MANHSKEQFLAERLKLRTNLLKVSVALRDFFLSDIPLTDVETERLRIAERMVCDVIGSTQYPLIELGQRWMVKNYK